MYPPENIFVPKQKKNSKLVQKGLDMFVNCDLLDYLSFSVWSNVQFLSYSVTHLRDTSLRAKSGRVL